MKLSLKIILIVIFVCSLWTTSALAKETYRIGVISNSPPFSFLSAKDDKQVIRGYTIDYWVLLGKIMGVNVKFVLASSHQERLQFLKDGKIDFVSEGVEADAKKLGYKFLPNGNVAHNHLYINDNRSSITCQKDLYDKKIVILAGIEYAPIIEIRDDMIRLNSYLEALNMVNTGVADAFISFSSATADYLIDQQKFTHILKKGLDLGEVEQGLIIPQNNPDIVEHFETAIAKIKEEKLLTLLQDKWFGDKLNTKTTIQYYTKHIALAICSTLFIFLAILAWNISLKRRVASSTNKLKHSELRYRNLIESSPDMIFLIDEKGQIIHSNERATSIVKGLNNDSQHFLSDIIASNDEDELQNFIVQLFNEGCVKQELILISKDDKPIEVEMAGRFIPSHQLIQVPHLKEISRACLYARDVTERNRLEEDLIQSERLGIIGKMAASLAHEINNPLGIIQANAEDLMLEDTNEYVKEGLTAIKRNSKRAGSITRELLDIASPKPMSFEVIDIKQTIMDSIALLGPESKKHNIEVNILNEQLTILGDSRSLQQILINLLFNSLSHIDQQGEIIITAYKDDNGEEGDSTVRIIVKDNGKGIKRENLRHIFEPFFSKRQGGFGLGLFITRRMVERQHGLIFTESELGIGTSMVLEFPTHNIGASDA